MSLVEKTVSLKASPQAVFEYVSDVRNHPSFINALKTVDHISGDPKQPGATWDWDFEMAGVLIKGGSETVECVEGSRFAFRTTSGIQSLFSYDIQPEGDHTRLRIRVEYEPPDSVLAKTLDRVVVERVNDGEGDAAVRNLATIFNTD